MKKALLYLSITFFSTKLKRFVTAFVLVSLFFMVVFHSQRLALQIDDLLQGNRVLVEMLLLALAIITCTAGIIRHVQSPEYLYIKTLPIGGSMRLVTIVSSTAATISLYLFGMIPLWDVPKGRVGFQFLYAILLMVSSSVFIADIILRMAKSIKRSKPLKHLLRILSFVCAAAALFLRATDLSGTPIAEDGRAHV